MVHLYNRVKVLDIDFSSDVHDLCNIIPDIDFDLSIFKELKYFHQKVSLVA